MSTSPIEIPREQPRKLSTASELKELKEKSKTPGQLADLAVNKVRREMDPAKIVAFLGSVADELRSRTDTVMADEHSSDQAKRDALHAEQVVLAELEYRTNRRDALRTASDALEGAQAEYRQAA